jgi:hypothetical protein
MKKEFKPLTVKELRHLPHEAKMKYFAELIKHFRNLK